MTCAGIPTSTVLSGADLPQDPAELRATVLRANVMGAHRLGRADSIAAVIALVAVSVVALQVLSVMP